MARNRTISIAVAGAVLLERAMRGRRAPMPRRYGAGASIDVLATSRRLVVVSPDEIGDFVLTTPFLRELRRLLPDAKITLVVGAAAAPLAKQCPHVDAIESISGDILPAPLRRTIPPRRWRAALATAARIRRRGEYDLALLPRYGPDYYYGNLIALLSGATRRVGYSDETSEAKRLDQQVSDAVLTDAWSGVPGVRHELDRRLDLLRFVGGEVVDDTPELWPVNANQERAAALWERNVGCASQVIALGIGAGHARRRWPADRFAALADRCSDAGFAVALVGGPDDRAAAAEIMSEARARLIDLTGQTTLPELACLLERVALFVSNDSGPMHIAAAAGAPIVEISCHPLGADPQGPHAPERFGPRGVPAQIVRPVAPAPPCRRGCVSDAPHCIRGVSVAAAWDAVKAIADNSPRRTTS